MNSLGFRLALIRRVGSRGNACLLTSKVIELAKKYSVTSGIALKGYETGDVVDTGFSNEQFDIVLLLGPLYHLTDRAERIKALSEARRILKQGGILLSAVISRYASLFDGFKRDLVLDPLFFQLLKDDLHTGIHLNKTENLEYFTTAYFHTAKEIIAEIAESGLAFEKLIAVESFGWFINEFSEKLKDAVYMERFLSILRTVESNEDLLAMSPHIIAVARK